MYVVGRDFQCWSTSGSLGRCGWSWQPITGLLLNTWGKISLGNSLQPTTEQYEIMLVMVVYEMAAPCYEMAGNTKWWPMCIQWGRTSCCTVCLAALAGADGNACAHVGGKHFTECQPPRTGRGGGKPTTWLTERRDFWGSRTGDDTRGGASPKPGEGRHLCWAWVSLVLVLLGGAELVSFTLWE